MSMKHEQQTEREEVKDAKANGEERSKINKTEEENKVEFYGRARASRESHLLVPLHTFTLQFMASFQLAFSSCW